MMNKISLGEIEIKNLLFLSFYRSIGVIQDLPVAVKRFDDKFCPVNGDKDSSLL